MDSLDLVARENEFKKLNKQLEKKTESLMKEIEHVMQKQDIFSEFSHNLTLSPAHKTNRHCCEVQKVSTDSKETVNNTKKSRPLSKNKPKIIPNLESRDNSNFEKGTIEKTNETNMLKAKPCCCLLSNNKKINDDLEFLYAFVSVNVKDKILPESFVKDKVTTENVCKFLSAKVKLMQEQIDKLQGTIDKKIKQCEGHMTHIAELESERLTLINRANSMRSETADIKAKCAVMQNRLDEKERLYKEQRSDTDRLTSEVKQLKTKNINLEARCASQEEVISNLKQQVEAAKLYEKDFRDSTRSLATSHQNSITRLEGKIKILSTHIDKQTSLIENLRKQNALLLTEGAVKALEHEYCEFLNQDL
ncbi:testis-expressed protein 9-like isoform X1 [Nymphalis io]|uniref:testis-expressed protein 9-like isoform X1 n=1 Tax=Inachis io TaxID=171585 RepID=UPI002169C221|nr:testis-expressed protein 9-like isoform X1 [Nymphalis io]